jgi:hypothetical protein
LHVCVTWYKSVYLEVCTARTPSYSLVSLAEVVSETNVVRETMSDLKMALCSSNSGLFYPFIVIRNNSLLDTAMIGFVSLVLSDVTGDS